MITQLVWTIWTSKSAVLKRLFSLITHPLHLCLCLCPVFPIISKITSLLWQLVMMPILPSRHQDADVFVSQLALDSAIVSYSGLHVSQTFYLPDFPNYVFLQSAYIEYRRKLCWNLLAQLVVLPGWCGILTHWGLNKMADILHTTFWNAFS